MQGWTIERALVLLILVIIVVFLPKSLHVF